MATAVHLEQWAGQRFVRNRRLRLLAAHNTFNANVIHQSGNCVERYIKSFPAHLLPDLANTVDAEVFLKNTLDLWLEFLVTLGAIRKAERVSPLGLMVIALAGAIASTQQIGSTP